MSSRTDGAATGDATPRWWWLLLAATFLIAAALRVIGLGSGLWYDEIVTLVQSARHPVAQIVTDSPGVNAHPLYSLLAHGSLVAFGESAWALRLPACVFGVASLVMVYILAASLTTKTEAWVGTALLATSYHHVWFSQNARGYTMLGFATLLGTWLLLRALRDGRGSDYAWYAIVCAAGLYTHLTMAFVIAGHVAVVVIGQALRWPPIKRQPAAPLWFAWVVVGVLSLALYAPFIPGLLALMGSHAPRAAAKVATAGWAASEALRSLLSDSGIWAVLLTGVLAILGGLSLARRQPLALALLLMPGVVTALGMIATRQPIRPRFFFFLAGGAAICMGRGLGLLIEHLRARSAVVRRVGLQTAVVMATLPLLAISVAALPRNYQVPKQDFETAIAHATRLEAQGARIMMAGPACLPLESYYDRRWHCVRGDDEWPGLTAAAAPPVLMVYTLLDYVEDPGLQQHLRANCPVIARFDATLRGGEIVICRPTATSSPGGTP
jgi:mannosyltransferase